MKLSLVFAAAGLVAVSAACSSRDRTEVERTTTTTITSAPVDLPQTVVTPAPAEPTAAAPPVPRDITPPAPPVPRDITPPAPTMAPTAATAAPTTAAAADWPARATRDLVERGQLVGPSLAPPPPPVIIFSNGPGMTSSPEIVHPSAASTETPADFSPKPLVVAPTSTGGQIFPGSTSSRGY